MTQKRRVLLIGLDGFTWRLGRRFIDEGVMPNLARLVESGCRGTLRSVVPFTTAPAWTSFMTGCRPGKTGVLTFHTYDRDDRRIRLNSFSDIAVPTIWELADRSDKTIVSLNMPVTSPPPKVKGVVIPGLLCPGLSPETVHPADAYARYIKPEPDYHIVDTRPVPTVTRFVDQQIAAEQARCRVGRRLMADVDWDIFFHQIQSTDRVQHHLWSALDENTPSHTAENRREVLRFYRSCDEVIGSLVEDAGPDTLAMIVSDHGFAPLRRNISINIWLRQKGYLHTKEYQPTGLALVKETLKDWIVPLRWLARLYGHVLRRCRREEVTLRSFLAYLRRSIDMDRTSAFLVGSMSGLVYINGTAEQRSKTAAELTERLLADFGPGSPEELITRITRGTDTFAGIDASDDSRGFVPDLFLHYADGVFGHVDFGGENVVSIPDCHNDPISLLGTHDRNGVLVAAGPGVEAGSSLDADIVDIVPTVLAWLGLGVPRHMDGNVLQGLFNDSLEIHRCDAVGQSGGTTHYTEEEQAHVEKRLEELGYL